MNAQSTSASDYATRSTRRRWFLFMCLILAVVVSVAVLRSIMLFSFGFLEFRPSWEKILIWQLLLWSVWVGFAPVIVLVHDRLWVRISEFPVRAAVHAGLVLVVVALHITLAIALWNFFSPGQAIIDVVDRFVWGNLLLDLLLYTLVVSVAPRMLTEDLCASAQGYIMVGGQSNEEAFRFESRSLAAVVTDAGCGRILAVNRGAEQLYGIPAEALRTSALHDLFAPEAVEPFEKLRVASAKSVIWGGSTVHRAASGERLMVDFMAHRIVFAGALAQLFLFGDVTALSREEEERHASERRAAELSAELANAKLRALELQLRPHFLFNALNTGAMLISNQEYYKARKLVSSLGNMFRLLLQIEQQRFLPLSQEMAISLRYLEVEQIRFEDRLKVEVDLAPETLSLDVPTLIIQPIIENAIKHGAVRVPGSSLLSVKAFLVDGYLIIEVTNIAGKSQSEHRNGIGISNTIRRLEEIWGDRASFVLAQLDGMMVATLRIPAS